MLNRKFTIRESLLLLLCAIIGLGIFYYEVVFKNILTQEEKYDVAAVQEKIALAQSKVKMKKDMESFLETHSEDDMGELALYNNLANVTYELGAVLNGADGVNISWADPTLKSSTVRRNFTLKFNTDSYAKAEEYIKNIRNLKYRILLNDLAIKAADRVVFSNSNNITVTLKGTIYEYVDKNSNLDGLIIINEKGKKNED